MEYYLNFIAMLNSNPQNEKQSKVTEKFMKQIKPNLNKPKPSQDPKSKSEELKNKYQWNETVQRKIREKQEREKQEQQNR